MTNLLLPFTFFARDLEQSHSYLVQTYSLCLDKHLIMRPLHLHPELNIVVISTPPAQWLDLSTHFRLVRQLTFCSMFPVMFWQCCQTTVLLRNGSYLAVTHRHWIRDPSLCWVHFLQNMVNYTGPVQTWPSLISVWARLPPDVNFPISERR